MQKPLVNRLKLEIVGRLYYTDAPNIYFYYSGGKASKKNAISGTFIALMDDGETILNKNELTKRLINIPFWAQSGDKFTNIQNGHTLEITGMNCYMKEKSFIVDFLEYNRDGIKLKWHSLNLNDFINTFRDILEKDATDN